MKALVTEGENEIALATVRSLGEKGIETAVVSSQQNALSFSSKYCTERIVSPPIKNKLKWVDFLLQRIRKNHYDVILFCGESSPDYISEFRDEFSPHIKFALPEREFYEIASNKKKMMEFAKRFEIPTPWTISPTNLEEVEQISKKITYPVVIKGVRGANRIRYATSPHDLISKFKEIYQLEKSLDISLPIIQEYVPGIGYIFLALFDHGTPKAIFMVKKIREYPITGGSCVQGESVFNSELQDIGLKILKKLCWHGIAEIEFILDLRDQKFKLIEINRDFGWTQNLAIACGINFAFLYYKMLKLPTLRPIYNYKTGIKYTWLLPYGISYIFAKPLSFFIFLWDFFSKKSEFDISLSDIKSTIKLVKRALWYLKNNIKKGTLRYPQGNPRIP